jgi:hypothetical protein
MCGSAVIGDSDIEEFLLLPRLQPSVVAKGPRRTSSKVTGASDVTMRAPVAACPIGGPPFPVNQLASLGKFRDATCSALGERGLSAGLAVSYAHGHNCRLWPGVTP